MRKTAAALTATALNLSLEATSCPTYSHRQTQPTGVTVGEGIETFNDGGDEYKYKDNNNNQL